MRYDYRPPHSFKVIIKDTRTDWESISDYRSERWHSISEGSYTVGVGGIAYYKGLYYGKKRPIVWVIDSTFQMITGYKKEYWIKHEMVEDAYWGNPEDIDILHTILLPDSMGAVRRMTLSEDMDILHEWFHPDAEIFNMRPVIVYLDLLSKPSYTYEWWTKHKKKRRTFVRKK